MGELQFQQFCQGRSGTVEKETHYINVVGYIYIYIYKPLFVKFKTYQNTLKPEFGHIKYDEKYMPELFLTLPELQNEPIE